MAAEWISDQLLKHLSKCPNQPVPSAAAVFSAYNSQCDASSVVAHWEHLHLALSLLNIYAAQLHGGTCAQLLTSFAGVTFSTLPAPHNTHTQSHTFVLHMF